MIKRVHTIVTSLILFSLSGFALAQDAPVLNYDMAQRAMNAALAEARENGWNLTIIVADHEGTLVMLHRMDGASARTDRKSVV